MRPPRERRARGAGSAGRRRRRVERSGAELRPGVGFKDSVKMKRDILWFYRI